MLVGAPELQVLRHRDDHILLNVGGQTLQVSQRIDRYVKTRRWPRPAEYIEIWALEDGTQLRLCRSGKEQTWSARWRHAPH